MVIEVGKIQGQKVYPVRIKYKGRAYLTLYYYTEHSDSLLHDEEKILCFRDFAAIKDFCDCWGLLIDGETSENDFDLKLENPIDYDSALNNWNLLNTIASDFGMYFEGNSKRYNSLYQLLFALSTPLEPIPDTWDVSEYYLKQLVRVFRKKERFLNRFGWYQEESPKN